MARLGIMSPSLLNPATSSVISGEISPSAAVAPVRDDRGPAQPQWSHQETKEFIAIRAELERDFSASKRNKTLWEVVSLKMSERGFRRSPEQCKCKWKNLVNRYKGKETSDPEHGRQCPFFEELHAIFAERAQNMQRLLLESETRSTQTRKGTKRLSGDRSSEEFSEDDDEVEDDSEEERPARSNSRKRKADRVLVEKSSRATNPANEWRQSMEKLERERLLIEQAWREREEQRRMREESRAERRDALLTTLLSKLIHESN
ncbi:trihelix transcription factor GT-3b-like [Senna tora]|uniref:Trihelix transcription factor GT-3b-like n=1 Tax=Senna tora TaxID=362788 RepID=A0A834SUE5_9FABA|nr:trihelix transcription factor GT-3b-like [Senna tora]